MEHRARAVEIMGGERVVSERICRACFAPLDFIFADLGAQPIANDLIRAENNLIKEPRYPLRVACCRACRLVQIADDLPADRLFRSDYVYQSSISSSFVDHARHYVDRMIKDHPFDPQSHIVEIASNDGYLLQFFKRAGLRVTGIEPSASVAQIARERHAIPTLDVFFGSEEAKKIAADHGQADLIIANNVLAHVPDLYDFVSGLKLLLKPNGLITIEFPHLLNLLEMGQFDTIYHEHYSYLSLLPLEPLFQRVGLRIIDVESLPVHGGSLRIFIVQDSDQREPTARLINLQQREKQACLDRDDLYLQFSRRITHLCQKLRDLLINEQKCGRVVAAYGAPAKGNTLLNTAAIDNHLIAFAVDKAPSKQGHLMPGSHIPIFAPEIIAERKPDTILILPWNIQNEIVSELDYVSEWGARFIVPIPTPRFLDEGV